MLDLAKGKPLILDQTDDSSHNNDMYDQLNKSVLTPNMYGKVKSKRGTQDNIVSANPYIKFKKDRLDTSSVKSATFRNKQSTSSSKKLQTSQQNALNKIIGELGQKNESNDGLAEPKAVRWPATDDNGDSDIDAKADAKRASNLSSLKAQKETSDKKQESISYVSQMNMQDQLDQMFESSSLIVSPSKSKRKKHKSNQKSTRRSKMHISPRKGKKINQDLEDLGQGFYEEDQINEDFEEEEGMDHEEPGDQNLNDDLNGDLIGEPVEVPQIMNQDFKLIKPAPVRKSDEFKFPPSAPAAPEHEHKMEVDEQINQAEIEKIEQNREKRKSMNNQKEQLTTKLRSKLKKLNK